MYQHFVDLYNDIFPLDHSLKESLKPFIVPDGHAVDLGCGTGRLVHLLHELGMKTHGVDMSHAMIKKAKSDFPNYSFDEMSMVDFLDGYRTYDLMTCFGNTLPHLNPEELVQFFRGVHQSLSKSGYCIITLLNYDAILKNKPAQLKKIQGDYFSFERFYDYQKDKIIFKTILTINDRVSEDQTILYPYRREELLSAIKQAGLHVNFYKNLNREEDDLSHSHLTAIITR